MIDELHIVDIALIKDAHISFGPGLTVITGETGAGKTALLGALKLLTGQRADSSLVRSGSDQARAEGRFYTHHDDVDGLVVQRRIGADGRSRVTLNGALSSVGDLAANIGPLVDMVGQHEHQKLLHVSEHARLLDAWASKDISSLKDAYTKAFQDYEAAKAAYDELVASQESEAAAVDQARFIVKSIEEVNPSLEDFEQLEIQLAQAERIDELRTAAFSSYELLGAEGGVLDKSNEALVMLERVSGVHEKLDAAATTLKEALYLLEDAHSTVRDATTMLNTDTYELESLRQRMNALQGLLHTWGPTMEQVLQTYNQAKRTIELVDNGDESLVKAREKVNRTHDALMQAATDFTNARIRAAKPFALAVTQQFALLEMQSSMFECRVELREEAQWTAHTPASVEFLYCPGKNMQFRPLARIASGGEISRVLLAIKVVLGSIDEFSTLVFDEVDAGVGGTAARALASVLEGLSKTHQVIVVTHLPQVAVKAQQHIRIYKDVDEDASPVSMLEKLDKEQRVFEIARMLSGDTSATALEHARALLYEDM